jgi:putative PIG3 family NAD(P)H quinone oxidoreductase
MRAIVITRPGGPEVLALRDVPDPAPGAREIRVRVRAFGINRADLLQRRGLYPAPPGVPPDIPGLEFAGEVDAVGDNVRGVATGDRVMGIAGGGTYAELVVVPAGHAVSIPPDMDYRTAAAIPEAFVTAHDALARLDLVAQQWLLIHAVGSGVGLAGLALAHARGLRTIGTSRTAEKLARARALGLDVGVDTTAGDFVAAARAATGDGAQGALDLVGGPLFPRTLEALSALGRVVLVGLTAGRSADLDLGLVLRRRLRVEGTVLRTRSAREKDLAVAAFGLEVLPLITEGAVRPAIHAVLPFTSVAEAHRLMEANANFGKLVVETT